MREQNAKRIKSNGPVSILVHGGNQLSVGIAKTLMEQGGRVILVDEFNAQSKKVITELREVGDADFVDFKGIQSLFSQVHKVDYIFYFLHEYLNSYKTFSSKSFLDESSNLNLILKQVREFNAKFALVTTVKLNQDLSEHILNSKLSAPSPYSPIELQKYCETLVAEYRDKSKINARIIRIGTILGKGVENIDNDTVLELLQDSLNKTFLTIYGEGLDVHYLINLEDAVFGVLKLMFTQKTEGEVINLANNHDYTTLSLAYKLLELNPDILEIKFAPSKSKSLIPENYVPAPNATDYSWVQKINIEQTLLETLTNIDPAKSRKYSMRKGDEPEEKILSRSQRTSTRAGRVASVVFGPVSRGFDNLGSRIMYFKENISVKSIFTLVFSLVAIILTFYFLLLPFITIGIGGASMYFNSKKAYSSISKFEFERASKDLGDAKNAAEKVDKAVVTLKWIFDITKSDKTYDNVSKLVFASKYALQGSQALTQALEPLSMYVKEFEPAISIGDTTPTTTRDYRAYLKELKENAPGVTKASHDILIASQMISQLDVASFPKFSQKLLGNIKNTNSQILGQVEPLSKVIMFLPDLLGVDDRQTYLVLLQNPGELRSTGGWISSYAIISLDGGQIRELSVDDVYNAEGQLRIANKYFNSPVDLQRALGLSRWSLSLSNWSYNLSDVATNAQYFLSSLDPGLEFDGVFTLDTEVVKSLLTVWGGIEVPGETEKITADNLDAKIFELHSAFIPGQPVKATFLANLANETFVKLLSSDIGGYQQITSSILTSLNEKHIQVYLTNTQANRFMGEWGWSGDIQTKHINTPIPIEWNWGGNKANLYLERNHSLKINVISKDEVNYDYQVYFQNKSTNNVYPQGGYHNYMRILLPKGASVAEVKGFTNQNYSTYTQGGYRIVAGWVDVAARSTKSVSIKYSLAKTESTVSFPITQNSLGYLLSVTPFKQPGTGSDIIDITVTYPDSWATVTNEGLDRLGTSLTARYNISVEKTFDVLWKEK